MNFELLYFFLIFYVVERSETIATCEAVRDIFTIIYKFIIIRRSISKHHKKQIINLN